MMTHRRKGSNVIVNVNSDWSGDAIVSLHGSKHSVEIPAEDLLRGWIRGKAAESAITWPSWLEAVSIAVEAFMRRGVEDAIESALDSVEIPVPR